MTNAEHIIAWAVNDRALYERLCNFEEKRGLTYRAPATVAFTATDIALSAYRAGRRAGDIVEPYSPSDILDAAKLALVWTKEG